MEVEAEGKGPMLLRGIVVCVIFAISSAQVLAAPEGGDDEEGPRETPAQVARAVSLGKGLKSKNKLTVVANLRRLGELHVPTSASILMDFVKRSKNAEHATYATEALGWSGNKEAVDFLCGKYGLRSRKLLVAEAACRSLGSVGDRRAIPPLLEAIKGKKVVITRAAIKAVVRLDRDANGLAALMVKLSKHKSPQVRRAVAEASGGLTDPSMIEMLIRLASRDGNSLVRLMACNSLGRLAPPSARKALEIVARNDKSLDVRTAAQGALARIPISSGD
jgi:HEAT repeat protein